MKPDLLEIVIVHALFWGGVLLFIWIMKRGTDRLLPQLEVLSSPASDNSIIAAESLLFTTPEQVVDVMGSYRNAPIHRYAIIEGKRYQFDHILLTGEFINAAAGERCISPGLVYLDCSIQASGRNP